jgi:hypothetical protein
LSHQTQKLVNWALQVSKNKVGEGKEEFGLEFLLISGGKWSEMIIIKFYTGVHVDYLIILANVGVEILCGVNIQGVPSTSCLGVNVLTNVLS